MPAVLPVGRATWSRSATAALRCNANTQHHSQPQPQGPTRGHVACCMWHAARTRCAKPTAETNGCTVRVEAGYGSAVIAAGRAVIVVAAPPDCFASRVAVV